MSTVAVADLVEQIRAGTPRGLARGLSWIEAGGRRAEELAEQLYPSTGHAHIVGITGPPGAGKSTIIRALVRSARARRFTVGVLAVDPSSPFSGGSILGDRIRMNDLSGDADVFIRSMATRGVLGGLCRAAGDAIDAMDAANKDIVFVETVGVGQDEVDVMRFVHTVVVVSVPGLGDDIQALKAGVFEIGDVHVVNKGDREGADRTVGELTAMLTMMPRPATNWMPPVHKVVATNEQGVDVLFDVVTRHFAHLTNSGELLSRRRRTAEARVLKCAHELLSAVVERRLAGDDNFVCRLIHGVAARDLSQLACARAILAQAAQRERTSHV